MTKQGAGDEILSPPPVFGRAAARIQDHPWAPSRLWPGGAHLRSGRSRTERAPLDGMAERAARGEPFLSGMFTRGEVVYADPEGGAAAIANRSPSSPARFYRNTPASLTTARCASFSTNWPARWAGRSNKRKYISLTAIEPGRSPPNFNLIGKRAPNPRYPENPDESRSLCFCTRWWVAICRGRYADRQCVDRRLRQYRPPVSRSAGAKHNSDGDA